MKRYPILFALACIALVGSIVAFLATIQERNFHLRGYVDATTTTNLPFYMPRLGVNAELTQYSPDELQNNLALMRAAHLHWVRQWFRWDQIEPEPGEFDWAQTDAIVEAFADDPQLKIVAVLVNTPQWARSEFSPDDPTAPPADPATYGAFAAAFAARYADVIDVYQIWDEPNLKDMWGGLDPRPVEYAAMLQAAYSAIHTADDSATVLAAALAPTTETGPRNISDMRYLHDLYSFNARDFSDGFAAKPYGFNTSPEDRIVREDTLNFSRVVALREEMTRQEDEQTPLWISNWGWNSLPETWQGTPSIWGNVSAQEQVTYTRAALERAEREWPWLGGMILYHWQPDAPTNDPVWGFSLLTPDDTPTPLLEALISRQPANFAINGLYKPTTPFARYSGVWTFGQLGADIGWLKDSQLEFDFVGSDVALLLRKDNYVAYLYPTIDGQAANALPRDADGNAYIVLTSGSREPELVTVAAARGLANTSHTLHVVADRGFDRWVLVGYAVSSGDLYAPYNRQITIAGLTALVALSAAGMTGSLVDWSPLRSSMRGLWSRLNDAGQIAISVITSIALMIGMLLTWNDAVPSLFRRDSVQLGIAIASAGLVYLNPGFVLTLVAAFVLFWVVYQRLALGLALIVFYAPFFLFPVELYSFAFPMVELLTLITFAAWLLQKLTDWGRNRQVGARVYPHRPMKLHGLDYAVIAWVTLGCVSLLWAQYRGFALTELRTMILEPALFYLMLRTTPLNQRDWLRLIDALLLAGFTVAVMGLFLYLRGEAIITAEGEARRLASVYGSPNNAALFLGRCIPFALAFALTQVDQFRRIAAGFAFIVFTITIVLTQSVGGLFLGLPAAVAAVLLVVYRKRAILPLVILTLIAGAAFIIGVTQSERFARALDFTQGTNLYRIRVWQSTFQIIADHPITGLGLDQFLYTYRGHYIYPDAWQDPDLSHPHNFLLDFWVRLGIGGVVLFIVMQLSFWRGLQHGLKAASNIWLRVLGIGTLGSMVNLLVHGLIDNSVYVIDLSFIFTLLLAMAVYLQSSPSPHSDMKTKV